MNSQKTGFTLVEMIVVVVIIAVLVAIAIPAYIKTQERAFDKDAVGSLKLIQAAEKIYRLEAGHYYPPSGSQSDPATINTNLKLGLPVSSPKWTYTANSTGNTSALRTGGSSVRTWSLPIASEDSTCSPVGNCP